MSVGRQRTYTDDIRARAIALHRTLGGNAYRAAKLSGVPRTTLHRWLARYGEEYGAGPAIADRVERLSDTLDAREQDAPDTSESASSVLAALGKLDHVRHAYLDRLTDPTVVARASARDASAVVQAATAQIQLLTGQPTGRGEVRVRYVEPGALREMARRLRLERADAVASGRASEDGR